MYQKQMYRVWIDVKYLSDFLFRLRLNKWMNIHLRIYKMNGMKLEISLELELKVQL